jgi:HPt (histidine-containing phosphotransfer) domain-containing protein
MQKDKLQETKVWNKNLLQDRVMHNQAVFKAVLNAFLEDMPQLSQKLSNEILNKNFKEIATHAHNIKGSAYNISADMLGIIARDIESAARKSDINAIIEMMPLLEEQLNLLQAEFTICLK